MKKNCCVLLGLLTLSPFGAVAAQENTLLKALPAETVILVQTHNMEELARKFKESPIYKLKDRSELAPLIQQMEAGWKEFQEEARKELDVDIAELLESCKGDVTLVLGSIGDIATSVGKAISTLEEPDLKPEMIPFLVVLDAREGKEGFLKNLNKLFDFGRKQAIQIETTDFHGGKVTSVSRPEDAGDQGPEHIYFGEHGSRFFISLSKTFLQQTIANLESGNNARSLAGLATFKTSHRKSGAGGDVFVYINLKSVVEAVDGALSSSMFAFFWQKFRQLFVGTTLNNIATSLSLEKEGMRQKSFFHNGGGSDGILGWLKTPAIAAKPSPLIPADSLTFTTMGVNMDQVANAIREVIRTVIALQGQGGDVDMLFEQMFQMKLDDIVRSLGNRLHMFQSKGPDSANPVGDLSIILELKDDAPLKQLLEKVVVRSQGSLVPEKYLGRDVYSVPTPLPGVALGFSISDRYVLFSMVKENVQKVIRRIGKENTDLIDSPGFQEARKLLPPKLAALSFTNEKYISAALDNLAQNIEQGAGDEVPEWLFPSIALLGKVFSSSIGYSIWEDEGLYSESWAPFRK